MNLNYNILIFFMLICMINRASTFKMKLIRRDNVDVSMFPPNLTLFEKNHKFAQLSLSRPHYHQSITTSELNPNNMIRPPLYSALSSIFILHMGVGDPNPKLIYLEMDTGSNLVWLQCKDCENCFQLRGGGYDYKSSQTFYPVPCNHSLCEPKLCDGNVCIYNQSYLKGASSGVVAVDTFTFEASQQPFLKLPSVVFGCATRTRDMKFGDNDGPENVIAGIFGMSAWGRRSFMSMTYQLTAGRFSYCLPPWDSHLGTHTYLTFGDEAKVPPGQQYVFTTPLLNMRYYLTLLDISVNDQRLNVDRSQFELKPDGTGGYVIDSGSMYSFLALDAYKQVRSAFIEYFRRYNIRPVDVSRTPILYDLCFPWPLPEHFDHPTMRYHFEGGAEYPIWYRNTFQVADKGRLTCMAILPIRPQQGPSILGAVQQGHYRFVYDLPGSTLTFFEELCEGV